MIIPHYMHWPWFASPVAYSVRLANGTVTNQMRLENMAKQRTIWSGGQ